MALLALVLLVHQPIYLVTQFLIARARQHEIARVLVGASVANIVLSVVLASTVGIWGVALSTLVTDVGVLLYVVPVAGRAGRHRFGVATFAWATLKPVIPGAVAALVVLVGIARVAQPDTLLELLPLGVVWGLRLRLGCCGGSASTPRSEQGLAASCGRRPRRPCPTWLARQVAVEDLVLVAPREHVPVEVDACPPRGGRELEPRRLVLPQVDDRVGELPRRRRPGDQLPSRADSRSPRSRTTRSERRAR